MRHERSFLREPCLRFFRSLKIFCLQTSDMAPSGSRVKQEQLRKRRNNLLRRHNDFWRLYSIRSWLTMEMPNGRIYTYHSHPHVPVPNGAQGRSPPAVHKTPRDYTCNSLAGLIIPSPPDMVLPSRRDDLWISLSRYLQRHRYQR
ncbi:unnamed protein product [Penicillium salamii]|uniref:Uncharacterized protein n=1 Tax=Penicillium salamii TaxID=1612424 RepID=A0A9W4N6M8_9EURO|nr:unnamed protein product [Penicillium salamii]